MNANQAWTAAQSWARQLLQNIAVAKSHYAYEIMFGAFPCAVLAHGEVFETIEDPDGHSSHGFTAVAVMCEYNDAVSFETAKTFGYVANGFVFLPKAADQTAWVDYFKSQGVALAKAA